MKPNYLSGVFALLALTFNHPAVAAPAQALHDHVPAVVKSLQPTGQFPATNQLNLAIALPLRDPAGLSNLLRQIYDPASPNFRHYLTPEQFAEQFGPAESDYQAVVAFADANGLRITTRHPNRVLLDVSGSVADVERALHVKLNTYRHPKENRTFYAPDTEPSLDLAVPILHISGLNNYSPPRPRLKSLELVKGQNAAPNGGSGPGGGFMGNDFRAAYAPGVTLNGAGQTVGLLQFDGYTASDITQYESAAGLPNVPLQNVLIDGATGNPSYDGGEVEVSLDIEMAISMAPNLSKVIVYEATNGSPFVDLLSRMANDNLAKQLSCSWYVPNGPAEPAADVIFQQMAAQGQSFFSASGDSDAYTGLIPFPGDTPYITLVGGTTLTTTGPGGSYVSETTWNWGIEYGQDGVGSGGGISTQYGIPSWQTNISMAANQGSMTMRNVPDVALTADHIYVRADGYDYVEGGTSCAAPLWAGFMALINQQAATAGQPPVGFVNPMLDVLATKPGFAQEFHDVTTGNNAWSGSPARFSATNGYDLCTGWGTPAGQKLIDALVNPEALVITPTTGFTSVGGFGGPFTVTSQAFSLTNAGINSLTWTLSNTSAWLHVSASGGTLTPGGPAAIVTVSLNNVASNLVAGTYSATVWFTNLNDNASQSRVFTLSVISPPVITMQPTNQAVLEGSTASFTVAATGGLPLAYQWQKNGGNLADGGNISGSATTHLIIGNVSSNDIGSYIVTVTNVAGSVTSSNALLTIIHSAPVIVMQPSNQTVTVGGTAVFTVAVIGTTPMSYQWSFDGTNIMGATNTALTLVNVQSTNAGNYAVSVTNAYGSTVSSNAVLSVMATLGQQVSFILSSTPGVGSAPNGVTVADVNGDGLTDMICVNYYGNSLSVLTNNGSSGFVLSGTYTVGNGPSQVVAADVNGDGKVDLICCNSYSGDSTLSVLTNNGSGRFVLSGTYPVGSGPFSVTVADVNSDGMVDLITANTGSVGQGNTLTVLTNNGSGGFVLASSPVVGSGAISVTAADVNGDGKVDLISANQGGNSVSVLTNNGSGGFVLSGTYPAGNGPRMVVAADVNGDGKVDLICADWGGGGGNTLTVLTNNGSGIFGSNATINVGSGPIAVASADVNGDGWMDLISANHNDNTLTVLTNNGIGGFVLATNLSVGGNPNSVTAADVNGDGKADLIVPLFPNPNYVLDVFTNATPFPNTPPKIIAQPGSITVSAGAMATFSVTAGGTPPLTYQWSFNGTNILWATNASLMLVNVQATNAGPYSVTVANFYGSTNSIAATLTVNPPPSCDPAPSGLVDWWAGEGNSNDSIGTNNGTVVGSIAYTNGKVGQAFSLNGSSGYVSIPDSPAMDSFTNSFTVELWIKGNYLTANPSWEWIATKGNTSWRLMGTSGANTLTFAASGTTAGGGTGSITGNRNVNDGQWHHVAGVYDGTNIFLYVDGTVDVSQPATGLIFTNNYPVEIGQIAGAGGDIFNGLIDEVSLYHRGLSASEIAAIYNAGSTGKCPVPPVIFVQPTNQTVMAGATAAFSVKANGSAPLFYQWSFNGTNIAGATNFSLTLANVQFSQSGTYAVLIANTAGSTNSANATLTVNAAPSITTQPVSLTNFAGSAVTFTVTAIGTSPLSYRWNFSGTNIVGATNTTLTLTNLQLSQSGNYAVVVTNIYGSVMSSNAALVVNPLLHFVWNAIPSSRFVGAPFVVAIQAQNPTNGLAAGFTNTVILLSTNGVPVSPAISGNFSQGVWTGAVMIAQTVTNLVLQASDSFGETGLANPINVVSLPPLTTVTSGGSFYIFWPANPAGFLLETSPDLSPDSWTPAAPPVRIGDQYFEPVQMTSTNAFYRLRFTGQ